MSATPEQVLTLTPAQFRDWQLVRELVKYSVPFHEIVRAFRTGYVMAALDLEGGNRTRAAKRIGLHRNIVAAYTKDFVPPATHGRKPRRDGLIRRV